MEEFILFQFCSISTWLNYNKQDLMTWHLIKDCTENQWKQFKFNSVITRPIFCALHLT